MWAKIGLKVKLNAQPMASFISKIQNFDHSAYMLGWGVATFDASGLAIGSHSIYAVYNGDGNYVGSTSSVLTQVVQGVTTTSVGSSLDPSKFGQSVTFTATVTATPPASGTPTGTVTFMDSATSLGPGTLSGGVATLSTSSLAVGGHTISVVYGGDSNFMGSTSSGVTQTVNLPNAPTVASISPMSGRTAGGRRTGSRRRRSTRT